MKLALTVQGPDANAPMDERFGRARYFHLVDTETGAATTIENADGVNAAQGAGIQAGQILARNGVQVVLTGHVGPKAWNVLQAAGIRVFCVNGGNVEQALASYRAGQLQELKQFDTRGHW
jgi:predicted Fe-Mo cluster-binding NifX family protein